MFCCVSYHFNSTWTFSSLSSVFIISVACLQVHFLILVVKTWTWICRQVTVFLAEPSPSASLVVCSCLCSPVGRYAACLIVLKRWLCLHLRCLIKWEGCLLDKPKLADRFELFSLNRWPRKSALLFEPPLFITFSFSVSYILRFASETVLRYVGQLSAYIAHHFTNYFYFLVLWKDWHFTLNRPNLLEISCAFFKCSLIFSHQIVELASRCFLHRN